MEKACSSCNVAQPIGRFSSFYLWSEAKDDMVEYHRPECRECYAERAYKKKSKAFGDKITEEEAKALREIWPSHITGESMASIHRGAGIKMGYPTFLKYCRSGAVEKWYRGEE